MELRRQPVHKGYGCGLFLSHATLVTFLFPFQPSITPFSSQFVVSIRRVSPRFSAHLIFTHLQNYGDRFIKSFVVYFVKDCSFVEEVVVIDIMAFTWIVVSELLKAAS